MKFVLVCQICTGTKRAMDREKISNAMKTLTPREREVTNGVVSGEMLEPIRTVPRRMRAF
jgi:FixJ family two-component response regulator